MKTPRRPVAADGRPRPLQIRAILRASYRKFCRDKFTRLAVALVLR